MGVGIFHDLLKKARSSIMNPRLW